MIYDICIIGSGPSCIGVLKALKQKKYQGKILVVEKGKKLKNRKLEDRMHGQGGAGTFTDMKLMIDDMTGGYLGNYLEDAYSYIFKSKDFYIENGAPEIGISPDYNKEVDLCLKYGFKFVNCKEIIHCGTDKAVEINKNIFNYFKDLNITWKFETKINNVYIENNYFILHRSGCWIEKCKKLIIATGRSNNLTLKNLKIEYDNNVVDLGIRCEINHDTAMKSWFDKFYHPKLEYITKTYQDKVRTFCTNPQGYVTVENYDDFKLVNGETYKNKKSFRTNFAILVSIPFTEPFKDGNEFARSIARTVNRLNNSKPIVQSYRDLKHGRRSTDKRLLAYNYFNKDLFCPGDLSIVIPHRYMVDIVEFIDNLDRMFTGIVDNMLLYGLEAKFYANKPKFINKYFEVKPGLYFCGDCSGVTRGIIQSTAMGIYIGEQL